MASLEPCKACDQTGCWDKVQRPVPHSMSLVCGVCNGRGWCSSSIEKDLMKSKEPKE